MNNIEDTLKQIEEGNLKGMNNSNMISPMQGSFKATKN